MSNRRSILLAVGVIILLFCGYMIGSYKHQVDTAIHAAKQKSGVYKITRVTEAKGEQLYEVEELTNDAKPTGKFNTFRNCNTSGAIIKEGTIITLVSRDSNVSGPTSFATEADCYLEVYPYK